MTEPLLEEDMSAHNYPPNDGQELPDPDSDIDSEKLTADNGEEENAMFGSSKDDDAAQADGELIALLEEKDVQIAELNDRFLRLAAELENSRRRAEREKSDAGKYAITELSRDLVTVADTFDRALRFLPANTADIKPEMVEALVTGLRMTEKELLSVLQRYNVNRIFPEGERFDPNLHQAVAQVPGNGIPQGFVVDVAQPGFKIGDRVLRAAMVTVSLGNVSTPKAAEQSSDDHEAIDADALGSDALGSDARGSIFDDEA